jgi:general secretion pathway protein I
MTKGFTLLEVMIAVALMAIALVTLIGSQAQSVAVMDDVRFQSIAAVLAREKLTDLRLLDFEQLGGETGNFEQDFEDFVWQTEVTDIPGYELGLTESEGMLKKIRVTISHREDSTQTITTETVFCRKLGIREDS